MEILYSSAACQLRSNANDRTTRVCWNMTSSERKNIWRHFHSDGIEHGRQRWWDWRILINCFICSESSAVASGGRLQQHQRDDQQATPLAIAASINHLNESLTSHSQEKNNRSAAAQLQWPRIVRSTRDAIARHVISLDSRTVHEGNLVADTATKLLFTADNHPRDKLISRFPTASLIAAHQWLSDKKQWHKEIVVDATMLAVVIVGEPSLKGHWV